MKRTILVVTIMLLAITCLAAELQPIAFPFTGRWQPSEDAALIDDYGLQDIQNMRKSGKHFKAVSGHTKINETALISTPYILNGFHFYKDQPQESHVLALASTGAKSYIYRNATAVPNAGEFASSVLHADDASGFAAGRFSTAPGGNVVYANGPETLIWGGSEIEATAVFTSAALLTGSTSVLTDPRDYSEQLRNAGAKALDIATLGNGIDSYTKLLLHFDGSSGSTTITDSSPAGRTVTAAGAAKISTAQSVFGGASLINTAASSDYVHAAHSADWDFASGDFSIEALIRLNTVPIVTYGPDLTVSMTSATTPSPNIVSASSNLSGDQRDYRAFNHNAVGSVSDEYASADGSTTAWLRYDFGASATHAVTKYTITATAYYNTNTAPHDWALQASNDAATCTAAGTTWATLDTRTGQTSWGTGEKRAFTLSNSTAYRCYRLNVTANDGNASNVLINEIELMANAVSSGDDGAIVSQWATGKKAFSFKTSGQDLVFAYTTDGSTEVTKSVAWTPSASTWYHVAISRSGDNLRFFVDGTQQGSTQSIAGVTLYDSDQALQVGAENTTHFLDGYLDEVRISKGVARWSGNFTLPVEEYKTGTKYWLVGFTRPIQGTKMYVSRPNTETSTITVQEWNGASWTNLSVVDGTSSGGITLKQTGSITWNSTVDTSKVRYINGLSLYWYQFTLSSGTADVSYITVDAPIQQIRNVWDGRKVFLARCAKYDGSTYTEYTDSVSDELSTTSLDISSLTTSGYFVVGTTQPQQGFEITMEAGQENSSGSTTMTVSYWSGEAWSAVQSLFDGTATSTTSLAKSGTVSFQPHPPGEFESSIGDATPLYYYKFTFASTLDASTKISEIRSIGAPKPIASYQFSEAFQNRLFLFNEYNGARNKSVYSMENAPDIFNGPDSGTLFFGSNTDVTAAVSVYNVFGNSAVDQLIVAKKNEIYRLSGDDPTTWVVKRISANIGCIAPLSMVTCEITGGKEDPSPRQVVIWQGDKGFYMTDGSVVVPISEDIKAYFDPNDPRYIPTSRRSKTVAWYDPELRAYKALITSGSGSYHNLELEYSLADREWTKIVRSDGTGADPLQSGFRVWDPNGLGYTYGGNSKGNLYRLENGNTFAGTAIAQYLHTKDMILDTTAPLFRKSTVKYARIANKKKAGGGNITITHYGDQMATVSGTNNQQGLTSVNMATSPYNTQSVNLGPFLYHSFKFSTATSSVADGMELVGVGLWVEPYTAVR